MRIKVKVLQHVLLKACTERCNWTELNYIVYNGLSGGVRWNTFMRVVT